MLRVQLRNIVIALLNEKCVSFSLLIVSSSYTELLSCSVGFFNNLYKILLHFNYLETSHETFPFVGLCSLCISLLPHTLKI